MACDKAFGTSSDLTRHTRTHTGDKPFQCANCGRAFAQKNALNIHSNQHAGVKPYPCKVGGCESKFSDPSSKRRHEREVHEGKIHACNIGGCTFRVKRRDVLIKHVTNMHPGESLSDAESTRMSEARLVPTLPPLSSIYQSRDHSPKPPSTASSDTYGPDGYRYYNGQRFPEGWREQLVEPVALAPLSVPSYDRGFVDRQWPPSAMPSRLQYSDPYVGVRPPALPAVFFSPTQRYAHLCHSPTSSPPSASGTSSRSASPRVAMTVDPSKLSPPRLPHHLRVVDSGLHFDFRGEASFSPSSFL